ncbi:MAG: transcription antitermination factor NusB [Clostridia bacterium]|nr:transcription antitermination factor NusB [Clostridia bacterium]
MGRTEVRDILFKLVYERIVREDGDSFSLSLFRRGLNEEETEYLESCYKGIIEKEIEIISIVEKYSEGFAIDRIYKIDLAILVVAIYELKFRDEIPSKVSANEAINLAKKYSTDKSSSFINGVLASVIKELTNVG